MDNKTYPVLPLEQSPKAIAELHDKVDHLTNLVQELSEKVRPGRPDILSLEQCAEFLGKTPSTIYTMCSRDTIPHHKGGNKLYFFMAELVEWMKSQPLHSRKHKKPKKDGSDAKLEEHPDNDISKDTISNDMPMQAEAPTDGQTPIGPDLREQSPNDGTEPATTSMPEQMAVSASLPSDPDTPTDHPECANEAPSDGQSEASVETPAPVKTDANPRIISSSPFFDIWHEDSPDGSSSIAYIRMKKMVDKDRYREFCDLVERNHGRRDVERKIYVFNSDDDALLCGDFINAFLATNPSNG